MIKISVDEAYAFDFFSILQVKKTYNIDVNNLLDFYTKEISDQLGCETFKLICESEEYSRLLKFNKMTFDAVDKAKTDEVSASYVDKCNYFRSEAKKDLQMKFFSSNLTEIKHGYEKLRIDE